MMNTRPQSYDFVRYLASKVSVDDRSLNTHVRSELENALHARGRAGDLRILEIGAGIGTMVERLMSWGLLTHANYIAVDIDPDNLKSARESLRRWGSQDPFQLTELAEDRLTLDHPAGTITLNFASLDARELIQHGELQDSVDLIIAHAFMDLVDLDSFLPTLAGLAKSGGLLYLTLNFDGVTHFRPVIDPLLDRQIEERYHQSMDERMIDGQPSGDSQTGSRLLSCLPDQGIDVIAAGPSDWVVHPIQKSYAGDEAYFLHHIIDTIDRQLRGHAELDGLRFSAWIDQRHAQIERGELTYIAHQIDLLGRVR
jgi:SAM-dependent methyltransferase